jgi:hypothetical protein
MSKQLHKLTTRSVATLSTPGRHSDGGGLYLAISPSGARSWVFMWKTGNKRREMGLGSIRDVPLAKARQRAADARQKLADRKDPLASRDRPRAMTFGEAADALIESMSPSWRSKKHHKQWSTSLSGYCADLRKMPVAAVRTDDVIEVLKPIWRSKIRDCITPSRTDRACARFCSGARAKVRREPRQMAWPPGCATAKASKADAWAPQGDVFQRCPRILRGN